MQIYNATIYPMTDENDYSFHFNGYLTWNGKQIVEIGEGMPEKTQEGALDARGKVLLPGLIDAHSHLGMIGDSLGFEGDDVNEDSDPTTPQMRALDAIHPFDRGFREARQNGVTAVLTGPGSANAIGGTLCAIKTAGICVDEMIIHDKLAMKFALGENPKSCYHQKNSGPETRMASAALIREALFKAKRYLADLEEYESNPEENSPPEYDAKCDALLPLLRGEMQAHFHAHRSDDICTAIRIAKEFGLDYRLVHCTEGHLIAPLLERERACAFLGPFFLSRSKPELANESDASPARLHAHAVPFALITDHPELPQQYLLLTAALAVKNGLDVGAALAAITATPAKLLGLDQRIGSLRKGLDADFALYSGDPLDFFTKVESVWINGERIES